ncbi:hypothetical protein C2857_007598 [Epichloe festucae Fl1]|uniref:Endoplasmic reticulum lectin n=1 Tax=Epichloe festucae (strain Fl1) TaxID=877507 RepID=A0A7S9KR73_EPIFF|nr:hypothetical protein C2857_007598 [Epichloe festucae Fl1]
MRRFNLVLLASLQMAAGRSRSFTIHDDLLAFPQFEIVFAEKRVSGKEAQALVERNNQHPTYSAEFSQATASEAHATTDAAAAGASSSVDSDEIAGYAYEILNMSPHRYLCSIPVIQPPGPVNETENALAKAEEEREHYRAAVKGWELINNFEDNCLYYVSGWWSYSFCKNREIVQYHAISVTSNGQIPQRDPNSQEYILGQVPSLPATTGDRHSKKKRDPNDPSRPPAELQIKGDQRYLVQRLEGGTVCDLTGKERSIEVQYQCVPGLQNDKIGWIKEVVTCSYIMMISTPRLCNDVAFQPPVEKAANPISCQLITDVSDSSQPLLEQHALSAQQQAEGVRQDANEAEADKEMTENQDGTPQITVGGIVVGGKRALSTGDDGGKPLKLQQLANLFAPQPKVLEIIAQAASKADGGKVKELTAEELESLKIDPKAVEEMREKLKKLAGDSGWKMEVFQMHDNDEKELLGYVDEPEGAKDSKGKSDKAKQGKKDADGGQSANEEGEDASSRERKGANSKDRKRGGREGSEEKFYNRDEL